jgi:hypothetical protein
MRAQPQEGCGPDVAFCGGLAVATPANEFMGQIGGREEGVRLGNARLLHGAQGANAAAFTTMQMCSIIRACLQLQLIVNAPTCSMQRPGWGRSRCCAQVGLRLLGRILGGRLGDVAVSSESQDCSWDAPVSCGGRSNERDIQRPRSIQSLTRVRHVAVYGGCSDCAPVCASNPCLRVSRRRPPPCCPTGRTSCKRAAPWLHMQGPRGRCHKAIRSALSSLGFMSIAFRCRLRGLVHRCASVRKQALHAAQAR